MATIRPGKLTGHYKIQVFVGVDPAGRRRNRATTVCPPGCAERGHARFESASTRRQVERIAGDFEREVAGQGHGKEMTVATAWKRWERQRGTRLAPATMATYRTAWRLRLAPAFGARPVVDIRHRDLAAYRDHHVDAGRLGPSTINQDLAVIQGVLRWAHEQGHIEANPGAGLRRASHGATETPLPEDAALFGLVVHLQRSAPTAALMVWLGLAIGARRGELAALRWSDIDLVAGTVSIDKSVDTRTQADKSTKTKGTRVVPVGEQVAVALGAERDRRRAMAGALWSESWPVFCTARDPSRRPHSDHWSKVVRRVTAAHEGLTAPCETCGVTDMAGVNLKALRHRVATEATRLAGARVAAALVGHASPVMTQNVYGHSRRDDGREVADQLSAGLPQLGAG